jgi:hypothetical protein
VVTPPAEGILPLAKARWFVEEAIRKLEAMDGSAAREILLKTVIPWFYATAANHSSTLADAQAQTSARWNCEEATRRIEGNRLSEARDILLTVVLAWLASPGPGALGILGVEEAPMPQAPKPKVVRKKATARKKSAAKRSAPKKRTAKKKTAKKGTAKKATGKKPTPRRPAAKKPKPMLLGGDGGR